MSKGILRRVDVAEYKLERQEERIAKLESNANLRKVLFPKSPVLRGIFESSLIIIVLCLMIMLTSRIGSSVREFFSN